MSYDDKEAGCAVREPRMVRIKDDLDRAIKRTDQAMNTLEVLAIQLLGNEVPPPAATFHNPASIGAPTLEPGTLTRLADRLNELHRNMSAIEHQIERLVSDL